MVVAGFFPFKVVTIIRHAGNLWPALGGGYVGVASWFSDFCDNLIVDNQSSISSRYKSITKRLNTDFWGSDSDTYHSRYVGSYGRNTAVDPFSDLDMIFQLPVALYSQYDAYTSNGQSALLQAVKQSIERTYSTTKIRADGQVIQVPFNDGITFEVVPAFLNTNESYTYPNANDGGSWMVTNPLPEIKAMRDRNDLTNGNLIPLCRMARAWRTKWDVPIGGLLIDTLAYQFILNFAHKDKSFLYYDYMCRDFFQWLSERNLEQEYWTAPGSGQYVYGKGRFQAKAKKCLNIALVAIAHEEANPKREMLAKSNWREIFGSKYPS